MESNRSRHWIFQEHNIFLPIKEVITMNFGMKLMSGVFVTLAVVCFTAGIAMLAVGRG